MKIVCTSVSIIPKGTSTSRREMDSWAFRYIVRPYLQLVKGRNAATLLLIIQRNVQPDSLVYIDEWAAYKQNQRALGFNQQTVNQSLNFVDSVTSVHTQHLTSFKLCFSNFNVLGQNSVITAISHYVAIFSFSCERDACAKSNQPFCSHTHHLFADVSFPPFFREGRRVPLRLAD